MGASHSRSNEPDEEERASLLGSGASSAIGSLKEKMGLAKPEPSPCPCLPDLSYTSRILGFAFCFCLGMLLSLTSMSSFAGVLLGHPGPFAFKYTVGNILSICSYCFLVGPARQCAGMFAPARRLATLAYMGSLVVTLLSVIYLRSLIVTTAALCLQFVAMIYYALSYIPYGHSMLSRALGC
mmetsp:Transcript_49837/g.129845  ORF Transcript_49837/g.129845 Transcript_49837/m.129845 type:complete len:182 (+) Transcript_49837:68-613(+)